MHLCPSDMALSVIFCTGCIGELVVSLDYNLPQPENLGPSNSDPAPSDKNDRISCLCPGEVHSSLTDLSVQNRFASIHPYNHLLLP